MQHASLNSAGRFFFLTHKDALDTILRDIGSMVKDTYINVCKYIQDPTKLTQSNMLPDINDSVLSYALEPYWRLVILYLRDGF